MVDHLIELAGRLGHWGYLVVFLIIMLECLVLLGLFMPGESLVLVSGFLAGQRVFDLEVVIVTISAAAIVGDSLGFELGRHLGREWLRRYGPWIGVRASHLAKAERYFQQHGGKSVFWGHFMHLLRALMPFIAGASGMRYQRFVIYNALGCILWASVFTSLGYFLGESWSVLEKWLGRAGAVFGGLLLLVIAVGWLWDWVSRHEVELRRQWQALIEQPRVAAFRRRFAPQIQFLQDRLTPGGYLGLHLTAGVLVIVLASWWLGGIAEDLLTHDPLVVVDQQVAVWFNAHAAPAVTRAAKVITFLGAPAFLAGTSGFCALVLLWRRSWCRLLTLALTMGGGSLLDVLLKNILHRQRPVLEHPLVTLSSYSFPSGHAMGSTLFYVWLAVIVSVSLKQWRWRVLTFLTAFALILLIGLTRIYLGAHYLSDVMGAMAAGLAWLAFCLTAVETLRRRNLQTTFATSDHED